MQTISLPYGRDRVEAQIPDQRLAAVLRSGAQSYRPQADQAQLVRQALENPIGTPPLRELAKGKHFIGKKVVEEAGEVWMAAEYEGREKTAEEISQLFYHLQVMMIANDLKLEDVYRYL